MIDFILFASLGLQVSALKYFSCHFCESFKMRIVFRFSGRKKSLGEALKAKNCNKTVKPTNGRTVLPQNISRDSPKMQTRERQLIVGLVFCDFKRTDQPTEHFFLNIFTSWAAAGCTSAALEYEPLDQEVVGLSPAGFWFFLFHLLPFLCFSLNLISS